MKKILFVCTGNICRSPIAHGVFRHILQKNSCLEKYEVDSAGVYSFHLGKAPDPRAVKIAKQHGIKIDDIVARQITDDDLIYFDLILAMDTLHYNELRSFATQENRNKIKLFLDYVGIRENTDVPDPYHGSNENFEYTFNLIEQACDMLFLNLEQDITQK